MRILLFFFNSPPRPVWIVGWIALALLIWFGGPLLVIEGMAPLSAPLARAGLIALLALGGLAWSYRSRLLVERRNMQLVTGLLSVSKEDTRPWEARPGDMDNALNIQEAAERLALAEDPVAAQERPWFLVLGPSRSGKTALLKNAKINPNHYIGTGLTRDYDWWFTSTGIPLLEAPAAAAYVGSDGHAGGAPAGLVDEAVQSANWKQFLAVLAQGRPKAPLDGVVLVVGLDQLMAGDEQQARHRARVLASQLQDLQTRLGLRLPCYIVFTMADTIDGFEGFFRDLELEGYDQVWGITFPRKGKGRSPSAPAAEALGRGLDALLESLRARRARVLAAQYDKSEYPRLFAFPSRFGAVAGRVRGYLDALLQGEKGAMEPWVRGVYFTSSATEQEGKTRKSYFVSNLFHQLVFKEVGLARQAGKSWMASLVSGRLAYALLFVGLLSVLGWWGLSVVQLRLQAAQMEQRLASVQTKLSVSQGQAPLDADRLVAVLDSFKQMEALAAGQPRWVKWSGLYSDSELRKVVRRAYYRVLVGRLLPFIQQGLETQLRSPWIAPSRTRQLLELYLTLGTPGQVDGEALLAWVRRSLVRGEASAEGLEGHVRAMLRLRLPPLELDWELVKSVRTRIAEAGGDKIQGEEVPR